jgi:hypothetical protein
MHLLVSHEREISCFKFYSVLFIVPFVIVIVILIKLCSLAGFTKRCKQTLRSTVDFHCDERHCNFMCNM